MTTGAESHTDTKTPQLAVETLSESGGRVARGPGEINGERQTELDRK